MADVRLPRHDATLESGCTVRLHQGWDRLHSHGQMVDDLGHGLYVERDQTCFLVSLPVGRLLRYF